MMLDIFVKAFRSKLDPEPSDIEVKSTIHLNNGKSSFQGCFSYTVIVHLGDVQIMLQYRISLQQF